MPEALSPKCACSCQLSVHQEIVSGCRIAVKHAGILQKRPLLSGPLSGSCNSSPEPCPRHSWDTWFSSLSFLFLLSRGTATHLFYDSSFKMAYDSILVFVLEGDGQ